MKILLTGGTGSFSRSFVKRILKDNPSRLVIFSRDEMKQEEMAREFNQPCMRYFVGDVRDQSRLELAMHGIDTVIHTAALKIVPTAEYNPTECIATNVGGAENVVKASLRSGVRKVIALSTDKCVNPVNLYGASKLAAEKIFMAANNLSGEDGCIFSSVRWGNVLGSRGSVVPLFKKLAAEGKPIPITDKRMSRFWITLEQAAEFALFCLNNMKGREIFIPKIPSMKVTDLAEAIAPGIPTEIIGIRPGEKVHEVLLTEDESRNAREIPNGYVIGDTQGNLPDGFRYSSDTNKEWLSVAQLREMISGQPA